MKSRKRLFVIFPTIPLLLNGMGSVLVPAGFAGEMNTVQPSVAKTIAISHYEFGSMVVNGKIYKEPYLFI